MLIQHWQRADEEQLVSATSMRPNIGRFGGAQESVDTTARSLELQSASQPVDAKIARRP